MHQFFLDFSNMVAFLDVDTFLQRGDLELLRELKWPWEVTHFAKAAKCVNCGFLTLSAAPKHFVVLNNEKIVMLLQYPFFWCQYCKIFAIYDHYTSDECTCNE